jgi:DNA processing protein
MDLDRQATNAAEAARELLESSVDANVATAEELWEVLGRYRRALADLLAAQDAQPQRPVARSSLGSVSNGPSGQRDDIIENDFALMRPKLLRVRDMREKSSPPYAGAMGASELEEQVALVALLQARAVKRPWSEITSDVLGSGSAVEVWHRLVPPVLVESPEQGDALEAAAQQISRWAERGWTLTTILDEGYPVRLREIHQAPLFLFSRGSLVPDDPAVSVVGSRQASDRGLAIAVGVTHELVTRGVTVVAGLARGIDAAAHRTALDDGGRTVGVIATGISRVYPPESAELHEEIATRGLLLSQFWPEAPPQKHHFLMRNATMSGYGLATVVVEAGEKSGARVQARLAVEHGRPVILTDLVVERNQWAQALRGRPGVHVASSLREVADVVDQLISERTDVRADLERLASA